MGEAGVKGVESLKLKIINALVADAVKSLFTVRVTGHSSQVTIHNNSKYL